MNHLIRPSFSVLSNSEKLDRKQSIYICFGPVMPVKSWLPALAQGLCHGKSDEPDILPRAISRCRAALIPVSLLWAENGAVCVQGPIWDAGLDYFLFAISHIVMGFIVGVFNWVGC